MPLKSNSQMHRHMRTALLSVLVAALSLSALLLAGGASAQRNENASGAKSKRVVGVRSSDTGSGSRVTVTADDSLKDYSAYRSGDRFYVVLPKAAAGARGGGSGRGYSDMQVQQRGDSVVLSYRVQPGAKPRVEQKFNRLDVVFDVPGGAGEQAEANNAARQQQQQHTPPAQQNNQAQAATTRPEANPTPERRQPTAEETAKAQAANAAAANTAPPATVAGQPASTVDPAAQNPATASTAPTQEPSPAATPAAEPQIAQAQQPAPIAPITTSQPAAATQTGSSLGTFLIQNWALALVFALVVVGLGLIVATRRTAAATPAPVEGLDKDAETKLEEPRPSRAKEATAKALKDASAAALASTLDTAKASTVATPVLVSKPEPVVTPEPVKAAEVVEEAEPVKAAEVVEEVEGVKEAEASDVDVKPLVAGTALAGGAAVWKSRKLSRKEARQEARRKKGARAEEPAQAEAPAAETTVAAPVVEETAAVEPVVEETLVHEEAVVETPSVEEPVQEETVEAPQAVTTEEVAEVVAEPEVAEHFAAPAVETAEPEQFEVAEPSLETAAPVSDITEVETTEVAPVEAETAEPFVAEAEAPAPVTEIEPAFAPDPERVLEETRQLLEGAQYDRVVIGSRDAMARQMIAAELLSALAGRNAQRRERAAAAFVEHGYYDETARDLREADAPAERAAAARSLAILGDRKSTPLLVAALEDPVSDVRRAAVEALGALRDTSAVEPLEALLGRERTERNRIPPRVIRTAIEFCREGSAEPPAAQTQTAIPAVEASEPAPSFEPEAAPAEQIAGVVDALPAEEPAPAGVAYEDEAATVEAAPVEETAVETVEETVEEVVEATGETAHVPEPVDAQYEREIVEEFAPAEAELTAAESQGLESAVAEPEAVAETSIEPFVDLVQPFDETEEAAAGVREESAAPAAGEFIIEPAADTSKGLTPAAGEWFDFDIGEMRGEAQPPAETTATHEPATTEPDFETSSGETFASPAAEVEEAAPFFEVHGEMTREIEPQGAAEAPPVTHEPESALADYEPVVNLREKGIAPFDETSTVPAAIQQRIASSNPRERAAAIIELSHVDTDEAFQQICAAFDDESKEVRAAAARALHELRADRAESFTRALREATPERRREIGASIATSGLAHESISQLTGESRERTYEAFSLLFLMAKAGEVQPLLRAIEGHPSNEVRLAVVKLLALSGQKEVLPAFRRLAVRGSLPTEVRSAVMEAIYQISSSQPTHA
jgi:HEAT repeat protein